MTLMIDLPPNIEENLELIAAQRGVNVQDVVIEALGQLRPEKPEKPVRREGEPIGEYLVRMAEELRAAIPDAEWTGQPNDHAKNYKHYLYGAAKEA